MCCTARSTPGSVRIDNLRRSEFDRRRNDQPSQLFDQKQGGGGARNRTLVQRSILQGFSGVLEAAARLQPRSGLPVAPAWRDDGFDGDPLTIQAPKNQDGVRTSTLAATPIEVTRRFSSASATCL
jgi:hypothetical protein